MRRGASHRPAPLCKRQSKTVLPFIANLMILYSIAPRRAFVNIGLHPFFRAAANASYWKAFPKKSEKRLFYANGDGILLLIAAITEAVKYMLLPPRASQQTVYGALPPCRRIRSVSATLS